jgi:hypothetical protein
LSELTVQNPVEPTLTAEPAHQRWREILDVMLALSLANLCFINAWFSPLSDTDHGYFNKLRVTLPTLLALATNLLGSAAAAWFVIRKLRRSQNKWLHLGFDLLLVFSLALPLDFIRRKVFNIADYQVLAWLRMPTVAFGLLVLLTALVWQHRRAAHATAVFMRILSPLALFILVQIFLLSIGVLHLDQQSADPVLRPPGPVRPGQPRVLWIIFDETDLRLPFEQRPATVKLPEFDRLRGESIFATNAFPPADGTLYSMPALICGLRVSNVVLQSHSDLSLTRADTGAVVSWSQSPSVFSSAQELGFNTAVVGWFHPYDRVLGSHLNYCAWHPFQMFESARAGQFGKALINQIECLTGTLRARSLFVDICRSSLTESLGVVTNGAYGLMLLHLPPPHKPGVWLPERNDYTIFGMPKAKGYFNNLELADHMLGQLRGAMEASGQWTNTWLLVSADHSWRESQVYDGRRDWRVPFILRAPDKAAPITYSTGFNTVLTHDLLLAILRRQVSGQQEAVAWLDAHSSNEPPAAVKDAHER